MLKIGNSFINNWIMTQKVFDHTSIKTEKFHPSSPSTKIVYKASILVIKPRLSNQFQSVSLLLTCQIHFGTMVYYYDQSKSISIKAPYQGQTLKRYMKSCHYTCFKENIHLFDIKNMVIISLMNKLYFVFRKIKQMRLATFVFDGHLVVEIIY